MNVVAYALAIAIAIAIGGLYPDRAAKPVAGAAHAVAYVDLPRLVAAHPLHAVLDQYDREIAALRATEGTPGLTAVSDAADRDTQTLRAQTGDAQARLQAMVAAHARDYRDREDAALTAVAAAPAEFAGNDAIRAQMEGEYRRQAAGLRDDARHDTAAYGDALSRETAATLSAYRASLETRTQRAYASRAQELREKESTYAADLERRDAGRRLLLTVKLQDLRLDAVKRSALRRELALLDAGEAREAGTLQRSDATVLAAYGGRLASEAAADEARMAAQLRTKASANRALRATVGRAQTRAARDLGFPKTSDSTATDDALTIARSTALRAGYRFPSDAASIEASFADANDDLSQRFGQLASVDRTSRNDTRAQLASLQSDRLGVYRGIVEQILRLAGQVARARGLTSVDIANAPHRGAVDLTAAVRSRLNAPSK